MLTLLAEFARMERETLIERTISGQRRAWEVEGKQKGRPKRDVSARCKVAINTVRKVKNAMAVSQAV